MYYNPHRVSTFLIGCSFEQQTRRSLLKAALALTLGRIFICPLFLTFYLFYSQMGISLTSLPFILLFLLSICELSDVFDGMVARKANQVTQLGKVLDPMADSIVRISILLAFTQGIVKLPLMLVFVFICRDAMISTLRTLCALKGVALAARFSGKIKAVVQAVAIFLVILLMIPFSLGVISLQEFQNISFYIVMLTAIYTAFSGLEYLYTHRLFVREAWSRSCSS